MFTGFPDLLDEAAQLVETHYGRFHPDGKSQVFPFPPTRTYERTMGRDLRRQFFVLESLFPEDGLAAVKRTAITLEDELGRRRPFPVERPINLDPGLINDCRVILASTKDYAHRIYRGRGVWEEITLYFEGGAWRPHPWTYPDFREPTYHEFFAAFRKRVLQARRTAE